MDEQIRSAGKGIVDYWKNLSPKAKKTIIAVSLTIIVIAVIIAVVLNTANYVVLFSGLDDAEVAEIMASLQDKNIDVKYQSDGSILVPKADETFLRMQLATEGYPRSGYNHSMFIDNVDFMTTDYEKRVFELMDLEEQTQASIETISGIEDAIVKFSLPEDENYAWNSESKDATASVKLTLSPGHSLTTSQVNGISRLVQTSVAGLLEENIAIIDSEGNELTSGSGMLQTDRFKVKMDIEKEIANEKERAVLKLLERVYGDGNVEVSVNCIVNLDQKISESVQYVPNGNTNAGVIVSEDINIEVVGDGQVTGGVVGTETNAEIPTYPDVTIDGQNIYYKNNDSIDYLVNHFTEQIQHEPGSIESLSAAIVINKETMPQTERDELLALVSNAAGIDAVNVAITNIEFTEQDGPITIIPEGLLGDLTVVEIAIIGAILLLILILLIVLIVWRVKKSKKAKAEKEATLKASENQENWDESMGDIGLRETRESALKKKIGDFANAHPEIVAQLIKTWLKGE